MKREQALKKAGGNLRLFAAMKAMIALDEPRGALFRKYSDAMKGGAPFDKTAFDAELAAYDTAIADKYKLLKAEIRDAQMNPAGNPLVTIN
jgi:hypothetical protein